MKWMNEWNERHEWMNERNEWMNEWNEWVNEWMNEWMNEMNEMKWMKWNEWNEMKWNKERNEWMNESMNEWMNDQYHGLSTTGRTCDLWEELLGCHNKHLRSLSGSHRAPTAGWLITIGILVSV